MELAEIVMNPVRQRIFQYFLLHETGTVKELRKHCRIFPAQAYIGTSRFLRTAPSSRWWAKTGFGAPWKAAKYGESPSFPPRRTSRCFYGKTRAMAVVSLLSRENPDVGSGGYRSSYIS